MSFDVTTIVSLLCLFILMISMSAALDIETFMNKLKKPKGIIIGIICQYGFLPIFSYLISILFKLETSQQIGLVITGSCPGGVLSNFFAFAVGADLSLSVAMTTASSITSFAFLTLNGVVYLPLISKDSKIQIDYVSLIISVGILLIGVLIGLYIAYKKYTKLKKIFGVLCALAVCILVLGSLITNLIGDSPIFGLKWTSWIAPLLLSIIAWTLAILFAMIMRLNRNSCVAVGMECAYQNTVLAISILLLTIEDDKDRDSALTMPIIYTLWSYLVIVITATILIKTGYLKEDNNDKTMTLRKLYIIWKNRDKNDNNSDDNIPTQNNNENNTKIPKTNELV